MTGGPGADAAGGRPTLGPVAAVRADGVGLLLLNATIAVVWCVLFLVLALRHDFALYADGSIFSYAIAVRDAWGFHWHNIAGRAFVYLYAYLPAEAYMRLSGNVHGAIALYALLFFSAPLLSLAATFGLDRSRSRTLFAFAAASTSVFLPFVFGFPTEMWIAHALFWPTLALVLFARDGWASRIAIAALLAAIGMTHGGGVLLALAVVAISGLRGLRHPLFLRALACLLPAFAVWLAVLVLLRPDSYFAAALEGAAYTFVDARNFDTPLTRLLAAALLAYALLCAAGRRLGLAAAPALAAAVVAAALVLYWRLWDTSLLADMRYPLRSLILVGPPLLGALAAALVLRAENGLGLLGARVRLVLAALERLLPPRVLAGALALVTLAHAVETAKFTVGWDGYRRAVRALAVSEASDPGLGDPRFVSTARLGAERNLFTWGSTSHFLSVLLAPGFEPRRLVVDPDTNYFWLTCAKATASARADSALSAGGRELIRKHACLHRP
ncbi:MAG: hypothetical protein NW223_08080 [Hyphomicrobiaceae bacterium]|nr:hypothetical protein [Hyphomicrobiaceae bacterium]